jgi:hypothetical protein
MAISTRTVSIVSSLVFSLFLIVGAYFLSSPEGIRIVDASSNEELFKSYVEKDTDNDGLKDWQEEIYGTDPENPESVKNGLSDGEALAQGLIRPRFESDVPEITLSTDVPGINAAPGTKNDIFAQTLLVEYLSKRDGSPPTQEEINQYIETAVSKVLEPETPEYGAQDISIQGRGSVVAEQYVSNMGQVFSTNLSSLEGDALEYFFNLVVKDDASANTEIKNYAKAYTAVAKGLIALSTPEETAVEHLALANAFARMGKISSDMSLFTVEPMRGLIALHKYLPAQKELALSMKAMAVALKNSQ